MASKCARLSVVIFLIYLCAESRAKINENKTNDSSEVKVEKPSKKMSDGAAMIFADEFKQTLDRYLFGICPQTFKMPLGKSKNATLVPCDLDADHQDLAGRLATLALRAHTAARTDCARFASALANTLGELARTAANQQAISAAATAESNKKRKLSKSQKMKIQAKQRTALAVKKKAAAAAAAAAAKIAT